MRGFSMERFVAQLNLALPEREEDLHLACEKCCGKGHDNYMGVRSAAELGEAKFSPYWSSCSTPATCDGAGCAYW